MKPRILATIAAALAASTATASPTYQYTYGYDGDSPHFVLSSADGGTIALFGDFVLTGVDDWDAAAEAANGRSLSYTHSYSSGADPVFDIVYTVCESADCEDWLGYHLYSDSSDDRPTVSVFYSSPTHSIGVLYYLLDAAYAVPEPPAAALMLAGAGLLAAGRRHRRLRSLADEASLAHR